MFSTGYISSFFCFFGGVNVQYIHCMFCNCISIHCTMNVGCVAISKQEIKTNNSSNTKFLDFALPQCVQNKKNVLVMLGLLEEAVFHQWFLCSARILTMCCELDSDGRTVKRGQETRCVENRKERVREGGGTRERERSLFITHQTQSICLPFVRLVERP